MSERYAPVPHRVYQLCGDDDVLLVTMTRLYYEAHVGGWRWLRTTTRDLRRGSLSARTIDRVLGQLVEDGLAEIEVVRSGGRAEGTRIRLFDPNTIGGDDRSMEGGPRGAPRGASGPAGVADPRPSPEHGRSMEGGSRGASTTDLNDPCERTNQGSSDERQGQDVAREGGDRGGSADGPRPGPSTVEPDPVALAELVALQEADEPQHGLGQPRDRDALRRALLRGATPEALRALWAWSGVSEDPLVAGSRVGGWRRWSGLLKAPTGQARIDAAVAWDRSGRPTEAPRARAGPGPPRRGQSTAGDGVLQRLREKFQQEGS